jgi:N-acetylmuramoyl-L-alanine amidase
LFLFDVNWYQIVLKFEVSMLITVKFWKWVRLKNVSFVILLLKMCFIFGQDLHTKSVIIIDPGHGGKDTGAIGINALQEKEVVLNIAKDILRLNKTIFDDTFDIYLTRYKDTLISLRDRTKLAKALNADMFISLHCNHAENSNAKGIEVYVHNSDSRFTKVAIELGLAVLNESTTKLGFKKRGVKFANFQVLRETVMFCPSVLVELGFVSNRNEVDYFLKSQSIKAMALAILLGITNYLNTGL